MKTTHRAERTDMTRITGVRSLPVHEPNPRDVEAGRRLRLQRTLFELSYVVMS
jgi:hypothetical protein